jgi:hypothetical protein
MDGVKRRTRLASDWLEPEDPSTRTYAQTYLALLALAIVGAFRGAASQCRRRDIALVTRLQRSKAAEHACTCTIQVCQEVRGCDSAPSQSILSHSAG